MSFPLSSCSSPRRLCRGGLSGFLSMRWKRKGLSTRWKLFSPLCRRCRCKWSQCTPTHAPLCALSSSAAATIYICTRYGLSTQEIVRDSASYVMLKHGVTNGPQLDKTNYLRTNDLCLKEQRIYKPTTLEIALPGSFEKKILPLSFWLCIPR